MSGCVQVFGRRQRRSDDTLRQPASEKRQGTKSREVGLGRRVPQAQLWGFERGTCHVDGSGRREVERLCGVVRGRAVAMIASKAEKRRFSSNLSYPQRIRSRQLMFVRTARTRRPELRDGDRVDTIMTYRS